MIWTHTPESSGVAVRDIARSEFTWSCGGDPRTVQFEYNIFLNHWNIKWKMVNRWFIGLPSTRITTKLSIHRLALVSPHYRDSPVQRSVTTTLRITTDVCVSHDSIRWRIRGDNRIVRYRDPHCRKCTKSHQNTYSSINWSSKSCAFALRDLPQRASAESSCRGLGSDTRTGNCSLHDRVADAYILVRELACRGEWACLQQSGFFWYTSWLSCLNKCSVEKSWPSHMYANHGMETFRTVVFRRTAHCVSGTTHGGGRVSKYVCVGSCERLVAWGGEVACNQWREQSYSCRIPTTLL